MFTRFNLFNLFLGAAIAAGSIFGAHAANAPPSPSPVSVLSGETELSVTNVTGRVILPSSAVSAIAITVWNSGTKDAYCIVGTSSVTATTSNAKIKAGASITYWAGGTHIACITGGSDTTTMVIYQGTGPLYLQVPASVSVSGTVAVTQSGTWTDRIVGNTGSALDALWAAATGPTNGVAILGGYFSANPTLTNGQSYPFRQDVNGDLRVVNVDGSGNIIDNTLPQQVYFGFTGTNVTTKTNTLLVAAAGHQLDHILINRPGTTDTLTVKDSAAADCSGGVAMGVISVISSDRNILEGWTSVNGICIVSGGTTAGDYTYFWR